MNQGEMILTPEDAALVLKLLAEEAMPGGCERAENVSINGVLERLTACAAMVAPPRKAILVRADAAYATGSGVWVKVAEGWVKK